MYSTIEKECLAIRWAVLTLRYYLLGREFTLCSDHAPLQWLHRMKDTNARITRWYLALQPFKFKVIHRPGAQMAVADFLSRNGGGGAAGRRAPGLSRAVGVCGEGAWFSGVCSGREQWETSGEKVGQVQRMITCVWLQWLAGRDRLRGVGERHRERRRLERCLLTVTEELTAEATCVLKTVPCGSFIFMCFSLIKNPKSPKRQPCLLPSSPWSWTVSQMYIYKWHEVDQTKHEIFCVHIVCNEIQVKVNLEITTFFFYLRFPYCPNFFWFGVVYNVYVFKLIYLKWLLRNVSHKSLAWSNTKNKIIIIKI